MDNYDLMSREIKNDLKKQLIESATSIGGKNHFLSLIEAVRMARPNPLMSKDASFSFDKGLIKWEKVIYKEKVNLLMSLVSDNNQNLMPELGSRNYRRIKNLVRTIGPIKFKVRPKNIKNGKGFAFNCIEIIDQDTCNLNFMFEVVFLLQIQLIKKIYTGSNESARARTKDG